MIEVRKGINNKPLASEKQVSAVLQIEGEGRLYWLPGCYCW